MITQIKEVYKCEFCNKLYQIKNAAIKHELICTYNPVNFRPCFKCNNLEKREVEIEDKLSFIVLSNRKVKLLFCNYKQRFLYSPKTELKGTKIKIPNEINYPMPKTCEYINRKVTTLELSPDLKQLTQ